MWTIWACLGFCSVPSDSSSSYSSPLDLPEDTSHWVNPHDMGGKPLAPSQMLARASQASKNAPTPTSPSSDSIFVKLAACSDCAELAQSLEACQKRLKAGTASTDSNTSQTGTCPRPQVGENVFLERYVRFLLRTFRAYEGGLLQSEHLRYTVKVEFSQKDLKDLQNFVQAQSSVTLTDVDRILSDMFVTVKSVRSLDSNESEDRVPMDYTAWIQYYSPSQQDLFLILTGAVTMFVIYMFLRGVSWIKIFAMIFGVSCVWHGTFMYRKAMAKKLADISEMPNAPPECFPNEMSWISMVWDVVFSHSSQKCLKYHEAVMIDPFLEVSPLLVVVETFTKMILHPLEHLGLSLSKFFRNLSSELSWTTSPFVFVFIFVVIIIFCIMLCGYRIRLPFWLGALEPHHQSHSSPVLSPKEIQELKQEVSLLKQLRANAHLYHERPTLHRVPSAVEQSLEQIPRIQELTRSHTVTGNLPIVEAKEDEEHQILSPPQKALMEGSLRKSPKKKLVAKGDVTSPKDTDFEWITEHESDENEEPRIDPPEVGTQEEARKKLDFDALNDVEIRNQKYLKKIEEIFEEPNQVNEH